MGSSTSECGKTLDRTAKPAETCEPEKGNVILSESDEQEEDTLVLAENSEQEEDTLVLAENGDQEEETELAENWVDCGSGEESCI